VPYRQDSQGNRWRIFRGEQSQRRSRQEASQEKLRAIHCRKQREGTRQGGFPLPIFHHFWHTAVTRMGYSAWKYSLNVCLLVSLQKLPERGLLSHTWHRIYYARMNLLAKLTCQWIKYFQLRSASPPSSHLSLNHLIIRKH